MPLVNPEHQAAVDDFDFHLLDSDSSIADVPTLDDFPFSESDSDESITSSIVSTDARRRFNRVIRGVPALWSPDDPVEDDATRDKSNTDKVPSGDEESLLSEPEDNPDEDGPTDQPSGLCPLRVCARAHSTYEYTYRASKVDWPAFAENFTVPNRFRRFLFTGIRLYPTRAHARTHPYDLGPLDSEIAQKIIDAYLAAGILQPARRRSPYVATIKHNGSYFQFTKLPFGLSVSPYHMQMFTNIIVQRFRDEGLTVWGHIDNFILGHLDQDFLSRILHSVLTDLCRAPVLVNWKKSILDPRRKLAVLGAIFDTISNTATLSQERKDLILRIFAILSDATHLRKVTLQRFVGHLAYVWPFIKSPWFLLHPLYLAI